MEVTQDNLLEKLETLEQELKEIRIFLSAKEINTIEPKIVEQEIIVDSVQKENEALKREVDQLHVALADAKASKDHVLEKSKALEQELEEYQTLLSKKNEDIIKEKQDFEAIVNSLRGENEALKGKLDAIGNKANTALKSVKVELSSNVKCSKRKDLEEMAAELKKRDDLIQVLEDKLNIQKASYDTKLQTLSKEKADICSKLELAKLEMEQTHSKSKAFEQHFSDENVKKLIAQVHDFMEHDQIESAVSTITSFVFCTKLNNTFNLAQIFYKIHRTRELLTFFEKLLLHSDDCNLISLTYEEIKNNIDYPNLILDVEKKFLRFCRDRKFNKTAFSLCDTLIRIRQCKEAWVYFEQGELLLLRGDFEEAREAYFYSLKFSEEDDPDLVIRYELAQKAIQLQILNNKWTLFNSDGTALPYEELHSKYKKLMRYYHPDKQHGHVKQYIDIAEYMTKVLTNAYRTLTKQ